MPSLRQNMGIAEFDPNFYTLGVIGNHRVVIPRISGIGTVHASIATGHMCHSSPKTRVKLLVGVCGGISNSPSRSRSIIYLSNLVVILKFLNTTLDGNTRTRA